MHFVLCYEYVALFVALAIGFVSLAQLGKLNVVELLAAGFLILLAVFIGAGLVVGYRSPRQLGNLLAWLARWINRLVHPFLHRDILKVASAYTLSDQMTEGFTSLRTANFGQISSAAGIYINKQSAADPGARPGFPGAGHPGERRHSFRRVQHRTPLCVCVAHPFRTRTCRQHPAGGVKLAECALTAGCPDSAGVPCRLPSGCPWF